MYSPTVQAIHHAFNNASDTILAEAKNTIDNVPQQVVDKVSRLRALGFTASRQVTQSAEAIAQREQSLVKARVIQDYAMRYPNQKFITREQVEAICKKYRLICAPTDRFTGFVPEKNLAQIEAFNVKDTDVVLNVRIDAIKFLYRYQDKAGIKAVKKYLAEHNSLISLDEVSMQSGLSVEFLKRKDSSDIGSAIQNYLTLKVGRAGSMGSTSLRVSCSIDGGQMQICAPANDFNLSGMKQDGAFAAVINKIVYTEIKDPIVLQPVRMGYLVVSCWGDEASDPIVVNQRMN